MKQFSRPPCSPVLSVFSVLPSSLFSQFSSWSHVLLVLLSSLFSHEASRRTSTGTQTMRLAGEQHVKRLLIPLMLLSMISCLYPLFFIFSTCFSLCVWNVASLEFVRRYLSISPLMIPRPVPGGWADEACTYCWVLVGLIWVLISRMPSLANLSPLYKHRSRNVISSVENSAVKLMRRCRSCILCTLDVSWAQPWVRRWHLPMLTFSWVHWNPKSSLKQTPHPYIGRDT